MINKKDFLTELKETGKVLSWEGYATKYGFASGEAARNCWKRNKPKIGQVAKQVEQLTEEVNLLKGEKNYRFYSDKPLTAEEIKIKFGVDDVLTSLSLYYNKEQSNGQYLVTALIKVNKEDNEALVIDKWTKVLDSYQTKNKPVDPNNLFINDYFNRPTSFVISLADFHLGKMTVDRMSIEDKVAMYKSVLMTLTLRAYKAYKLEEIVYVTSNDFLHFDNYQHQTTKGTAQNSIVNVYDEYEIGFDLQTHVISFLKNFCTILKVIHVPSNHARTREYYMLHALETYFKNDSNIIFDRTAEPTKCHVYGSNFLGFHHGDIKDISRLPAYFSNKYREQWGSTKFAEIALGDKHIRKYQEIEGTRMFICPTLTSADTWHRDNLYDLAIKASIGRVYDKETGYCCEFEERI